jgi:transcriptional/translational regulatory protein YebC/TACO1
MDAALEAGADDIETDDDGGITVTTPWENLSTVVAGLTEAGFEPDHCEVTMVASTTSECDLEMAEKVLTLIDVLEDLDDVQEVHTNGEFPEEAYA